MGGSPGIGHDVGSQAPISHSTVTVTVTITAQSGHNVGSQAPIGIQSAWAPCRAYAARRVWGGRRLRNGFEMAFSHVLVCFDVPYRCPHLLFLLWGVIVIEVGLETGIKPKSRDVDRAQHRIAQDRIAQHSDRTTFGLQAPVSIRRAWAL